MSENAKIDSNYHKTLLAVDESTGETKRLLVNASGALKVTGTVSVTPTPAGSDTQVQFNDGGAMGADAGLTYNKTTDTLTVAGAVSVGTSLVPDTNDGATLGTTSLQFSDLFLAEGGVINWDNGDATCTQTNNTITWAGINTFNVGTSTAVGLGTIELGNASDTTLSRVSAGVVAIEGVNIVTTSSIDTLTNKTIGVSQLSGQVSLANGGTGANLVDPNADRIMFWDDSAGAVTWLSTGDSLAITTTTIDTIQDIRTTATPQFARLGLGQAADSSAVMAATGQYFSTRDSNGNSTATATVDWNTGNVQAFTLNDNCTFTFSNPKAGGRYLLELLQDGTGSRTVTWPASVKWSGGTTPTLTTTAGRTDIITFYYNGTSYAGSSTLNFSM